MDTPSHQLFRALSRFIAEPLLLVSADERCVRMSNRAAQELLGRDAATLEGQPLAELLAQRADDAQAYLRMCARSVQPLPGALHLRHASGAPVACRVKGARLLLADESVVAGPAHVLWRLEPRGRAPSPFVLLNEKIAHLTHEVVNRKRAEQEALEALRVRDEFLAVASHELKTPLHAFNLQLELVIRTLQDMPEAARRLEARLSGLRKQLARMTVLSSSLLDDVSQLRSGSPQLRLQPVDLGEAVRASVERMGAELERAGCPVRLDVQPGVVTLADVSRLDQVLVNLLSNAAKYGAGRPVEVATYAESCWATARVRDHGIGIAPEDLGRIFERFERAASARHYGGLGLGLYVSRQLAQAMGGALQAASAVGEGSTFTLQLPRHAPPDGASPREPRSPP